MMNKIGMIDEINRQVQSYNLIFNEEVKASDQCPCGSGMKYKNCCQLASSRMISNMDIL